MTFIRKFRYWLDRILGDYLEADAYDRLNAAREDFHVEHVFAHPKPNAPGVWYHDLTGTLMVVKRNKDGELYFPARMYAPEEFLVSDLTPSPHPWMPAKRVRSVLAGWLRRCL